MTKKKTTKTTSFGEIKEISGEQYIDEINEQIAKITKENIELQKKIMQIFEESFETSPNLIKKYEENNRLLQELFLTEQNFNYNYSHVII